MSDGSRAALQTRSAQEDLKRHGVRPWPVADDVSAPFWDGAAEGRLVLQRCVQCSRFHHPPVATCPDCAGGRPEWVEVTGRGTVYSFIVDHRNMVPGFDGAYIVALVSPDDVGDDSVRLVTNLPGCDPGDVRIGMRVRAVFEELRPGVWVPQFVRAED